jgi:signal transduction histidine kinase
VIDAVPLALVALDPDQRITAWNADAATLFGLREEHRHGMLRSVRGGRLTPLADAIPAVLAPSKGSVEVQLTDAADQAQVVLLRGSAVPASGIILVAESAPVRRGVEERMKQLQKVETVGRVATGVAHDFNNILTAILGHAEFMLGDDALAGERREDAVAIRNAVLRASSLTRRLLAFSRHRSTEPVPIDVNAVLRELEELMRRVIGSSSMIELQLDDSIGLVRMDPGDLEQVILNLVVNAREAMPRGGRITVLTGRFAIPDAPADVIGIAVRDEGEGMDTETLAHIFEPFFTTKLEGTGIGLATVYSVTLNVGGQVAVDSVLDRGTTFTIRLPRHVEAERPRGRTSAETRRLPQILIVEDEAPVRMVIARVLERAEFRVIAAASAEEAMAMLTSGVQVDLVLSDLTLPGEDGRAFLDRVQATDAGIARVLMSGHAALGDMELGGVTFVGKPFAPVELLSVIRECLARRGATSHS